MKPGIKSTEFWLTLMASIWPQLSGAVSPELQIIIPAGATAVYTIMRGLAKFKAAE